MFYLYLFIGVTLYLFLWWCIIDEREPIKDLNGKHVVVTGGSSGIGKAAAIEAARQGAHVTIIGRDVSKLKTSVAEISSKAKSEQKIQYASLDVTSDYDTIAKCLSKLEEEIGPIFMLVNSAGMCICGQFEKMKVEDIKHMIDLNYFGSAYPTRYVLEGMKERNDGMIILVSTEAALIGIYGYSAYSAAKWAVRGLAETLLMECVGTNVKVTLAFPPDTDTPGYAKEEESKPEETKLISGAAGLFSADKVGRQIIRDAMKGKSYSVFGVTGYILGNLFCGSIQNFPQVMLQMMFAGLERFAIVLHILYFQKIVKDGLKKRAAEKAKDK